MNPEPQVRRLRSRAAFTLAWARNPLPTNQTRLAPQLAQVSAAAAQCWGRRGLKGAPHCEVPGLRRWGATVVKQGERRDRHFLREVEGTRGCGQQWARRWSAGAEAHTLGALHFCASRGSGLSLNSDPEPRRLRFVPAGLRGRSLPPGPGKPIAQELGGMGRRKRSGDGRASAKQLSRPRAVAGWRSGRCGRLRRLHRSALGWQGL